MMQQYKEIKEEYKDAILFFRLGDFYEMFFDDALIASKILNIALTGRDCGLKERAPMCGVPYHSCQSYIAKLIENGYKVAICEQLEDPSKAKGIVKRDVVKVITPGTVTDENMLDDKRNNYLLSIFEGQDGFGIAYIDITTGEFYMSEIDDQNMQSKLIDEIAKIHPSEIISNQKFTENKKIVNFIKDIMDVYLTCYDEWAFEYHRAKKRLLDYLGVITLDGYGCSGKRKGISAAGALMEYVYQTQKSTLKHINGINFYSVEDYMMLDIATRLNLEITQTMRGKQKKGSLLWVLDKTNTSMGARMMRKWIEQPLLDIHNITMRLDGVEELKDNMIQRENLKDLLSNIYDIERLMGKISAGTVNAKDFIALKQSIAVLPDIKALLSSFDSELLKKYFDSLDTLEDIYKVIDEAIIDDPPNNITEGGIIKAGYNAEVDELRKAGKLGKEWIASLEKNEKQKTGIKTLKVGFNKVFGYYIEVTKSYYSLVPDYFIRKQTLANAERYVTPELKEMEFKILGAEEKVVKLEYDLFSDIRQRISKEIHRIKSVSEIIACIDCLFSFAQVADVNQYIKPELNNSSYIDIKGGRHPVVEKTIKNQLFVKNDTYLDSNNDRLCILTGPNMAGKSTYMRQVALITLLAQIGCFVPADKADLCITDRIFTRVGASDDLSSGQSTFMVEMIELANILNNATENSLVILDEIGRGTSTFDGLSIAWAAIEYISDKNRIGAKTLFATHYHELTELEGIIDGVKNYCISVKEEGEDIIFLRKIKRGGADKSFGIQVAKLAGLPQSVIKRAEEILNHLESKDINKNNIKDAIAVSVENNDAKDEQIDMYEYQYREIVDYIKNIDILDTTPLEAMNILNKLINKANNI